MVFNIASAGLVWTDYKKNATDVYVTHTEYALSITQIVFVVLGWIAILHQKNTNVIFSISLFIVQIFNIAYSAYIIEYYNNQEVLPLRIIDMTLAIIILNCLSICGCFTVIRADNP